MKAIIIALFVFIAIASIFQVAIGSPDFQGLKPWSSNSNMNANTNSIEAKLSEALQGVSAIQKSNFNPDKSNANADNDLSDNPLNNSSGINKTATNSSAVNSTVINSTTINSTDDNSTTINASAEDAATLKSAGDSGAVSLSGSSSVSPHEVGSSSKANFNGFWGMEANQEGIGKSGINSKTFLSGDFEVDKTVQFQDRGY
jgi:hypothetical protein